MKEQDRQAALEFALTRTNKRLEIFKEHNSGIPEKNLMREFAQNEGVYWDDLEPIINAAKRQLDQYRKDINADAQAALDALGSLQSSLKDALHSLLVSHCAGYMSSTEYGIKRSSIEGHISNCEIIRAALTAQLTKTDDNVSYPNIANMGDINVELLNACNVALGHMTGGMDGDWRDCDPITLLRDAIARAEQKGGE